MQSLGLGNFLKGKQREYMATKTVTVSNDSSTNIDLGTISNLSAVDMVCYASRGTSEDMVWIKMKKTGASSVSDPRVEEWSRDTGLTFTSSVASGQMRLTVTADASGGDTTFKYVVTKIK
jgi:hypothetical protein